SDPGSLPLSVAERLDRACDRFEADFRAGRRPRVEDYLGEVAEPERPALLRELVASEVGLRRRLGERPAPEDYRGRFPDLAAYLDELLPTVDGGASPSSSATYLVEPDVADGTTVERAASSRARREGAPGGSGAQAGPRFQVLRQHARGGLGVVFVAHDGELNREVALKEMRPRHAGRPESRARFLLEAEVTGGLEHPGIVPVYSLGRHADGSPYYAMRLIRGDSLKEAIERFHQAEGPGRDPGERALALRRLLGRFLDACNAVAYAHS